MPPTNKRFLNNMLVSTLRHSYIEETKRLHKRKYNPFYTSKGMNKVMAEKIVLNILQGSEQIQIHTPGVHIHMRVAVSASGL